jgi:antitoxin component YwqK of YwqJK toxin-antitoxin module
MHRLSVKHSLSVAALSSAVFLGSIGFLASRHILLNSEDLLELEGYGYNFNGAPFSGIAFDMYENWRPKHLQIFWKGKFLATEYLWYHDGQQMAERPHKDGLPHGQWKMWYPDGSVKSLRTYEDGQLTGEMWGWHSNGQVSDFNLYDKGQEISHKSWVSDGTPYYNYVYYQGKKVGMKGGEFCKPLRKRSRK